MKFITPATSNPIDQLKIVGRPVDRVDGPMKASGSAPFAHEQHQAAPNAAYGYVLGAAIAKGRIASMNIDQAKRAPGVITIVTAIAAAFGKSPPAWVAPTIRMLRVFRVLPPRNDGET